MKLCIDLRDWCVGVSVDEYHIYLCFLTIVLRINRGGWRPQDINFCKAMDAVHKLTQKEQAEMAPYVKSLSELKE